MKTYKVSWRQTFETKLEAEFEASSEKAAINKARKLSKQVCEPGDQDTFCTQSYCPDYYGGDDFSAEQIP